MRMRRVHDSGYRRLLRLPFAAVNLWKSYFALTRVDAVDASRSLVVKSSRLDGLVGECNSVSCPRNRVLIFIEKLYRDPGFVFVAGLYVLTVRLGLTHLRHLALAECQHDVRLAVFCLTG